MSSKVVILSGIRTLAVVLLTTGCAPPSLLEGVYACDENDHSTCPEGWFCLFDDDAHDFRCFPTSVGCGNGVCDVSEGTLSCPVDCYCGNGSCDQGEDEAGCPGDCFCGNDVCDDTEDTANCPVDCYCGNDTCDPGETAAVCSADCTESFCGDGTCDADETAETCAEDCGGNCGNGVCDSGETAATCPTDCHCGNGLCDPGETEYTCAVDCASPCGDGVCSISETRLTCPADCHVCGDSFCDPPETAAICPADCGGPYCGDGTCDTGETAANCPQDCGSTCTDPVCDLYPQCGCSGGQKCTISVSNRACMNAGITPAGDVCTAETDCAAGTMCRARSTTEGQCLSFCDPTSGAGCTGASSICLEVNDPSQVPIPGAGTCTITCQPNAPAPACPATMGCDIYTHNITQEVFTDCHGNVGPGTNGAACDTSAGPHCAAGYGCHSDGTTTSCYQWCTLVSTCAVGTCNTAAFDPPITVAGTTYGVCL